jgi:L-ornithine Nalpha-acyltransferase
MRARFAKPDGAIVNVVTRAGLVALLAVRAGERDRALALRQRCFRPSNPERDDSDAHDDRCQHLLVEDADTGAVLACCRLMVLADGGGIADSYSSGHYDLGLLGHHRHPMMEIGRFCIDPECRNPDVLRFAWAALTRLVDRHAISLLFGCSSLAGASALQHREALAVLAKARRAPERWAPSVKSRDTLDLANVAGDSVDADPQTALPPLLRSYLSMGGWISDHAVVDRDLDTLHVFTALEVSAIPPARARALRLMAAGLVIGNLSGD